MRAAEGMWAFSLRSNKGEPDLPWKNRKGKVLSTSSYISHNMCAGHTQLGHYEDCSIAVALLVYIVYIYYSYIVGMYIGSMYNI